MKNNLHYFELDLTKTPEPLSSIEGNKIDKSMCYSIGDLHGNAVKLLHFMLFTGAAHFEDSGAGSGPTPDYYQLFLKIYQKDASQWTQEDIEKINEIMSKLVIDPQINLQLIGDDLCDRGNNDYLTLKLMRRFKSQGGKLNVILSNHTAEFINLHEHNYRYESRRLGSVKTRSSLQLQELIDKKLITPKDVDDLYQEYQPSLQAFSYGMTDDNELLIFSHAPVNEIDILRCALCLRELGAAFTGLQDMNEIEEIYQRVKPVTHGGKGEALTNQDLIILINLINQAVSHCAANKSLTTLLEYQLKNTEELNFGWAYDRDEDDEDNAIGFDKPFDFAYWNRDSPTRNMTACSIRSQCRFINPHGHVSTVKIEDPKHINLDSLFGMKERLHYHGRGYLPVMISKKAHFSYLSTPEDLQQKMKELPLSHLALLLPLADAQTQMLGTIGLQTVQDLVKDLNATATTPPKAVTRFFQSERNPFHLAKIKYLAAAKSFIESPSETTYKILKENAEHYNKAKTNLSKWEKMKEKVGFDEGKLELLNTFMDNYLDDFKKIHERTTRQTLVM